jgi:polar amino acid transport system substrate-binding protein
LQFLCGSDPVSVFATSAAGATGNIPPEDIVSITIRFDNGSVGTIHYFANGDKAIPKEYLEVFGGGRVFQLDDFKQARYAAGGSVATWKSAGQDKGQSAELERLITAAQTGGPNPIPLRESVLTTLTTFRILDSLHWGIEVPVGWQEEPDPLYEPPYENIQRNSIVV